MCAFFFLEISW